MIQVKEKNLQVEFHSVYYLQISRYLSDIRYAYKNAIYHVDGVNNIIYKGNYLSIALLKSKYVRIVNIIFSTIWILY